MSKNSNLQRTESLRLWLASTIKFKNKDAQIFCDPSKRRISSTSAAQRHDDEVMIEIITPEVRKQFNKKVIPRRK